MNRIIIVCMIEAGTSPEKILKEILKEFPELIGKVTTTDNIEDVVKTVSSNVGKEIVVITGNLIREISSSRLNKNADLLFNTVKKINNEAKVFLYSTNTTETISPFDDKFQKSSYGDYGCVGLKNVFKLLHLVKTQELKVTKISRWQKFLALVLK